MAKTRERNRAFVLRQKGESVKDIARKLKIAKSTVSLWCRDIKLTPEQIQKLHEKMVQGGYEGRMKGARMQYEKRLKKIEEWKEKGIRSIGKLSNRDLLIAGIALYWGEGSKKRRGVSLSNSDPEMIKFIIKFFKKIWGIDNSKFSAYIGINKIHKDRIKEVERYWSKITRIPREQFTKTTLIKARNKKSYKNFSVHYGTITLKIRKSAELYYQINGLIQGLIEARIQAGKPGSRLVSRVVS